MCSNLHSPFFLKIVFELFNHIQLNVNQLQFLPVSQLIPVYPPAHAHI